MVIQNAQIKSGATVSIMSIGIGGFVFLSIVLLQGGCWLQASGYHSYPPVGEFVTITYPTGQTQRILTHCTGPRDPTMPTFWFEVGGGGHSMSDLWGLRDYLNDHYNR